MAQDTILTTLHGRRFGLTSSGGLLTNETGSTAPLLAVMRDTAGRVAGAVNTAAVVATTLVNYGLDILSSATATAATYILAAPAAGVPKKIAVACTASEITLQGTATSILFGATGADKLFISGADNRSKGVILEGQSTTRWAVLALPTGGSLTGG